MNNCQRCKSARIARIIVTSKDHNITTLPGHTIVGYPPAGVGLGAAGDDIRFAWCLDCGQIQGEWPVFPEEED